MTICHRHDRFHIGFPGVLERQRIVKADLLMATGIKELQHDKHAVFIAGVEKCRRRWLHGAAESLHSVDYNGKYEDEERGNGNE